LLEAILFFIVFDQIFLQTKCPEIVIDLSIWFLLVNWCIEVYNDGSSTANLGTNIGLYAI